MKHDCSKCSINVKCEFAWLLRILCSDVKLNQTWQTAGLDFSTDNHICGTCANWQDTIHHCNSDGNVYYVCSKGNVVCKEDKLTKYYNCWIAREPEQPIEDTKQSTLNKYKHQIDNDSRHFLEFGFYIKSEHAIRILEDFADEVAKKTIETHKMIEYKDLPDSEGYWFNRIYGIIKVESNIEGDFYCYMYGSLEKIRCLNVTTKWAKWAKIDTSQFDTTV